MDAMDSFSDKGGNLMEEVYQYMTQAHYMYPLGRPIGCTEGRKRSIRRKATKFVIVVFFATLSLSFVVVLMLHYKINFPFHFAILSTKV